MSSDELYKQITKRIRKRYQKRKEYFGHLIGYLAALFGIFIAANIFVTFSPSLSLVNICGGLMLLWGFGLAIHTVLFILDELENRSVDQELGRAGLLTERQLEKAKRGERLVTLSDDGELHDLYDDYYDEKRSYE